MPVTLTVARSSSLYNDQDGDGVADFGDVLRVVLRITNTGDEDALNLTVTDTLNGLTLVPGSVMVTPVAVDDVFNITGNTPVIITKAQLLGNDFDPDGAEANIVITGVTAGSGGTIVDNGDNTYTFTPTTGFQGAANFTYTIQDEQGLASVDAGTVTVNVSGLVWYVDQAYGGANGASDGSYLRPFTSLAPLNGVTGDGTTNDDVDGAGHTIFVYNRGAAAYNGGITLEADQKLFGDGHAFEVNGIAIGADGNQTIINHATANTGYGVTLATGNEIRGLTVNGGDAGTIGIRDGNGTVGTLTIANSNITGTGKALDIDQGGTLNVTLDTLNSSASSSEGVHLQGLSGSFTVTAGLIQTSTGTGVLIGAAGGGTASSGGNLNVTFGAGITNPGGSVVEIQDRTGGTVTFTGTFTEGGISAGQTGILIDQNAGTINFNNQILLGGGGAGNGVTINNSATGTVNFSPTGNGLDISLGSGTAFTWTNGGTLNITGAGNSIATTTGTLFNALNGTIGGSGVTFASLTGGAVAGNGIVLNNVDGGTFNGGNVSMTSAGTDGLNISGGSDSNATFGNFSVGATGSDAIEINGSSGDYSFTGNVTLNTGAGNAINLVNNLAGSSATFSGGNLNIDTTTGWGIRAVDNNNNGDMVLSISGGNNSVVTTSGGAIFIDQVTTQATLLNVHSNGGSETGIYLRNTGGSGFFTVTGTGSTAGSGGTIQSKAGADLSTTTGIGVYLEGASNVSLSNMSFTGTFDNFGILGHGVNNFTLRDSAMTGTFGSTSAHDEGAIRFGNQSAASNGLTGTGLFEGNVIGGGRENNLAIFNGAAGTLNLTVRDSANDQAVFNFTQNVADANDDIMVETGGSSVLNMIVQNVEFAGARSDSVYVSALGNTNQTIQITGNDFTNASTNIAPAGGAGVTLTGGTGGILGHSYTVDYLIQGNTFTGSKGVPLAANYFGHAGNISGYIANNVIGTNNGVRDTTQALAGSTENANGGGIYVGVERAAGGSGNLNHAVVITGNTIRDIISGPGIFVQSTSGSAAGQARVEATITNNTVDHLGNGAFAALRALIGGNDPDSSFLGLDIRNNTLDASDTVNAYGAVFLDQIINTAARFYTPGYGDVAGESLNGETYGGNLSTNYDTFLAAQGNTLTNGAGHLGLPGVEVTAFDARGVLSNFILTVPTPLLLAPETEWTQPAAIVQEPKAEKVVDNPEVVPDGGGGSGGGGGQTTQPVGDPEPYVEPHPVIVDDGVLSQAELDWFVEAAIQRWIDAGASEEQIAAMRAVSVTVADMMGLYVGSSNVGTIKIDSDGAGIGWFLDGTPGDDAEYHGSGTRLSATAGGPAAGKIDLLTVLMHELGHQIGLEDSYASADANGLMYGWFGPSERRLPAEGEAEGATPGTVGHEAYALAPVVVGTLPDGYAIDVIFDATVDQQSNQIVQNLSNTGTATYDNGGGPVQTNSAPEVTVLDTLTLGNLVFLDANKNGVFDGGDTGISGVTVNLFADSNNDNVADGAAIATTTTDGSGNYSFTGLAPGNYIVQLSGAALSAYVSAPGATDPDDNVDNDDNGKPGASPGTFVSDSITLAFNEEPTPGTGNDTNNTLDFAFQALSEPTGTDETVSVPEDGRYAFAEADFGFGDVDGNAFTGVTVTTVATDGKLYIDTDGAGGSLGTEVTAGQVVTKAEIDAGQLVFVPDANENGDDYATFTFQVRDDGGSNNVDTTPNTMTIDVTAVNDAPTATNLDGDSATYTEGGGPVFLDSGAATNVGDVDSVNFSGGSLTVAITANEVAAEDVLGIDTSGAVTLSSGTDVGSVVSINGFAIGTITSNGTGGNDLAIAFNTSDAVPLHVSILMRAITYSNSNSDNPTGGDRTVTWTLVDGDGVANGGQDTLVLTSTVTVDAVDDPGVANNDADSVDENATVAIAVLANDTDVDGPAPAVGEIEGQAVNAGDTVTLASGAEVTLNNDGTITYDPNGAYDWLISAGKAAATGALNSSANDSFTYKLANGGTATVTVTVNGVDSAGDELHGDGGNNTITGTAGPDLFMLNQGGDDDASGGDGNDGFYMGAALGAGDQIDGQGGSLDQLGLQGNYAGFTFGAGNLVGIEMVVLLSGSDTRFGDTGTNFYDYDLTTVDENVGPGQRLILSFNALLAGEDVTFDGSAETDGSFLTYGGLGVDDITGGQQDDGFYFGAQGRWGAGDRVDGQGGAMDQLGLQGNYSGAGAIVFGANQIANIEMIVLLSGGDTRFGSGGLPYSYDITMNDGNVAAGQVMTISANTLRVDEVLTFDGSAETDGAFIVYGGLAGDDITGSAGDDELWGQGGDDVLTGGLGADELRGGAGNDTFVYLAAADSTAASRDSILDFATGDKIDLSAIDAIAGGGNDAFTFVGSAAFSNTAGELRAVQDNGNWIVEADIDGDGVADLSILVTRADADPMVAGDFVL